MDDEKLKLFLAILGGIVFSLIFILLAFVLPIKDPKQPPPKTLNSQLQKISKDIKESKHNPPPEEQSQDLQSDKIH